MRNQLVAALAISVLAVGGTASVAQATEGSSGDAYSTPSNGTPDVFGTWTWSHFTDWQTDPTTPADPDGRSGEANVANVVQIGERYADWVAGSSRTETTGWVTEPPGAGWTQIDQRPVTLSEATEDSWTDKVWHTYTGNWKQEGAPPLEDSKWHATSGSPQSANHSFENHTPNVPYFVSNDGSGNGDWFLWSATFVPGHDAEQGTEYRFERTVETPGHEVYQWSVYERVNTPGTPAEPETPEHPVVPGTPEPSKAPHAPQASHTAGQPSAGHASWGLGDAVLPPARSTGAVVPTSIDAGL